MAARLRRRRNGDRDGATSWFACRGCHRPASPSPSRSHRHLIRVGVLNVCVTRGRQPLRSGDIPDRRRREDPRSTAHPADRRTGHHRRTGPLIQRCDSRHAYPSASMIMIEVGTTSPFTSALLVSLNESRHRLRPCTCHQSSVTYTVDRRRHAQIVMLLPPSPCHRGHALKSCRRLAATVQMHRYLLPGRSRVAVSPVATTVALSASSVTDVTLRGEREVIVRHRHRQRRRRRSPSPCGLTDVLFGSSVQVVCGRPAPTLSVADVNAQCHRDSRITLGRRADRHRDGRGRRWGVCRRQRTQ